MKKYIVLLFSLFFGIGSVNAYYENIQPNSIIYGHPNNAQYAYNIVSDTYVGTLFYHGDITPGMFSETLSKGAFNYDFTNYDYDYFSVLILISGSTYGTLNGQINSVSVQFAENNCENVGAFNGGGTGYFSFVCKNYQVNDYLNIYPSSPANKIAISSKISFYNDLTTAKLTSIEQLQQQQHQDIINDDTSGNANNFSSDINNFSVPNDSHALDILGTLQNFVGNIQVSGACSRILVPIPFTDKNFTLPCMTTDVYSVHFREIVVIWQLICRGVGYYYILVNVLKLVKETLDPFNFKLEVLDL